MSVFAAVTDGMVGLVLLLPWRRWPVGGRGREGVARAGWWGALGLVLSGLLEPQPH